VTRPGLVIAMLSCLGLAACGLLSSPEKQMRRAEDALARGAYAEAAVLMRGVADKAPENGTAWLLLARALHQQGDADGAERTLQLAVENGAPAPEVAIFRAERQLANGSFQELLDDFSNEVNPVDDWRRRYYRARALQGLGRVPEALAMYQQLVSEKDTPELHLRIAQCHYYHGRHNLAVAELEKAPGLAEGWLLKLRLAQRANDKAGARDALQKAIDAAPGQLSAVQQGQILLSGVEEALRADHLAEAEEYRAALLKMLPQAPVTRLVNGQVDLHKGVNPETTSELQKLVLEQPGYYPARALLIAALLRAGSIELGLKEAGALAAARPDDPQIRAMHDTVRAATEHPADSAERSLLIASALNGLQQPTLARLQLQETLARHPDALAVKVALAQVEVASGRTGEAIELVQGMSATPEGAGSEVLVAIAQERSGDLAAAAATYERLWKANPTGPLTHTLAVTRAKAGLPVVEMPLRAWLGRNPNDLSIRLQLATALQEMGDMANAVREYERILAGAPPGHPLRPVALNNLAVAYSKVGDRRALETARQAYESAKSNPSVQDTYGWLLTLAGRASEALPLLTTAAAAMPTSAEVRYHHAAALAQAGQKEQARLLLSDALLDSAPFDGRAEAEKLLASL
jgi:tetratricopeptide (TPR) repeat protein